MRRADVMRVIKGNIWDYHKNDTTLRPSNPYYSGCAVVVTTNGEIRKDGKAVMGAGIALQAAQRFPYLSLSLAEGLRAHGNVVHYFPSYNIITFPTKYDWRMPSDLSLIERSAVQLASFLLMEDYAYLRVIMTKPGCGHGKLSWPQVEPILTRHLFYLGERVRIIEP